MSADSGIDTTPSVNPLPNTSDTYGTSQNLGYFSLSLLINTAANDGASCTFVPNNVAGSLWIINFTTESSASVDAGATGFTTALNLIPKSPGGTPTHVSDVNLQTYTLGTSASGTTITNSPNDSVDGQITFNSGTSASTSTTLTSSQPTATYGTPPSFTATVTNISGSGRAPTGVVDLYDETTDCDLTPARLILSGSTSTTSTCIFTPTATELNSTIFNLDSANTIEAIYTPTGSFLASTNTNNTVSQVINQATLAPRSRPTARPTTAAPR